MAKDRKIGIKYLAKNNIIVANNYYNVIIAFGAMGAVLFLLQPSILMMIIFGLMIPLYFYLYKKKNKSIITSVTIYPYHTVFTEILFKSFKINKDFYSDVKKLFNSGHIKLKENISIKDKKKTKKEKIINK